MISRETIREAYLFLRKNNQSIPTNTLDFMLDASLSMYEATANDGCCVHCQYNGKQMIYPGECTGCGAHGEMRNFKLKQK